MSPGNIRPASSAKMYSTKKSKDRQKPKRACSAYNFFVKSEREKVVKFLTGEGQDDHEPDQPDADPELLKKPGGRFSFEQMGKLMGTRWKTLSSEGRACYDEMVATDKERYKKELALYKARIDEQCKQDAQDALARQSHISTQAPTSYGSHGTDASYYGDHYYNYSHAGMPLAGSHPGYPVDSGRGSDHHMPQSSQYGDIPYHQYPYSSAYCSSNRGGYCISSSSYRCPSQHAAEPTSSVGSAQQGYVMSSTHPHHPSSAHEYSVSGQSYYYPPQVPSSQRSHKEDDLTFHPPPQVSSYPRSPKGSQSQGPY